MWPYAGRCCSQAQACLTMHVVPSSLDSPVGWTMTFT